MGRTPLEPSFRAVLSDGTYSEIMSWKKLCESADLLTSRGIRRMEYWSPNPITGRELHGEWLELTLAVPRLVLQQDLEPATTEPA